MALPVHPTIERVDLPQPPGLEGLRDLAENLWWTWHPEALRLFARIDPDGGRGPGTRYTSCATPPPNDGPSWPTTAGSSATPETLPIGSSGT